MFRLVPENRNKPKHFDFIVIFKECYRHYGFSSHVDAHRRMRKPLMQWHSVKVQLHLADATVLLLFQSDIHSTITAMSDVIKAHITLVHDISNVWTKLAESNLSQHSQQLDSDIALQLNMFRHSAHSCQNTLLLGARTSCSREVFCCVPLHFYWKLFS